MAVFSLLSENLGNGIIIKNNKLFLDTSIDNVWTGKNFFSKPVIFSQNQIFPIENLSSDNTAPGSFIVFGEKQWKTIGPGSYGQSLIFTSKGPMWSNYNLSNTEGILPTSKGGTGWGKYPYNGILFSSDKEVLDLLPIPSGRKILFSENSLIHWEEFSDLADEILVRLPKPIESIKNKLIYKNSNPAFKLQDQLSAGLHFNNKSLNISINHTDLDDYAADLPTSSICLNNENKNFLFELKTNVNKTLFESCFSIDSFGNIVKHYL
jgi:hypothetical protein